MLTLEVAGSIFISLISLAGVIITAYSAKGKVSKAEAVAMENRITWRR